VADQEHLNMLAAGPERVREWIAANPGRRLDLAGAQLPSYNFAHWFLENANFQSANLEGARFNSAILRNADLSSANLAGATLGKANFTGANLDRALLTNTDLREGMLADASIQQVTLEGVDFSDCDLRSTRFQHSKLSRTQFSNAQLQGANFSGAELREATFDGARLDGAILEHADLEDASVRRGSLRNALLTAARLNGADLDRADLFESFVDRANFDRVRGLPRARNLHTARFADAGVHADVRYFDSIVIPMPEKTLGWEHIRFIGRLPLFAASYSALIAIPLLYYLLDIFNRKVDVVRAWAMEESSNAGTWSLPARVVLDHLHREPVPSLSLLLLVSTLLLGLGATIFVLFCPTRVREFSRDQWCDQLGHSLIHYWPLSWRYRWLRLSCLLFYIAGGTGVLVVLVSKLWNVFWFIIKNG